MAAIVLRDIPKERVELDARAYAVGGGFRGFQNVLPGYHLVSVHDGDAVHRAEVVLADPGSAIVLLLRGDRLVVDGSDEGDQMSRLAASGAMNRALVDAGGGDDASLTWRDATSTLDRPIADVPVADAASDASRFAGFWAAHGGNRTTALRDAQAAFVRLFRDGDFERLRFILQAHYNAGERGIKAAPSYFAEFARFAAAVLRLRPDLRVAGSAAVESADYLVQDLRDCDLGESADHLERALRPESIN